MLFTSCAPKIYYQVYKAASSDKVVVKDNYLVYEDDNCKVSYNLWNEGGNIGFELYNKTNENIYLNLEECFFVYNGRAYNYFKDRVFTTSANSGVTALSNLSASKSVSGLFQTKGIHATSAVGSMASSGYSISYNEEKIVCIPSKTSKAIAEYNINESLYRDCDLLKYPKNKKQITSKFFSKTDSPILFSNRIAYATKQSQVKFENEFYIAEISNFPEREVVDSKYDEFCGEKAPYETKYFKNIAPDKFYIKYVKNYMFGGKH